MEPESTLRPTAKFAGTSSLSRLAGRGRFLEQMPDRDNPSVVELARAGRPAGT